jgi:hypothetical protein
MALFRARLDEGASAFDQMTRQLAHGIVFNSPSRPIYVVRIVGAILGYPEIDDIAEQMRGRVLSRYGEQAPNIVVVQGDSKETLRLFGDAHAVTLVRTALFNAAVRWSPLQLD